MRRDLDEAGRSIKDVRTQVNEVVESRPSVDAALRDLEELRGAHTLVQDALEQAKRVHEEVNRLRDGHAETRSWLTDLEQTITEVRGQIEHVYQMAPTIEQVKKHAQVIHDTSSEFEKKSELVESVQRRLDQVNHAEHEPRRPQR